MAVRSGSETTEGKSSVPASREFDEPLAEPEPLRFVFLILFSFVSFNFGFFQLYFLENRGGEN